MKNILLIGQCTLHWGRMEFGNIGNYYIIEPFVRELHRVFPQAKISTTFQMSDRFCQDEQVEVLPIDYYYDFGIDNLPIAEKEYNIAKEYAQTGKLKETTPYIDAVMRSDLVIDFSGDIWGDNADFLGKNRLLVGLLKDRVAQLMGKPTVMLAGSPGPFSNSKNLEFAREVYKNFTLVTNRESLSIELMKSRGFDVSNTHSLACPAFLFEPSDDNLATAIATELGIVGNKQKTVGFILCGWNFLEAPFDKKNRRDDEFTIFAEAVEFITEKLGASVFLMSHSNGFPIPPREFKLIHGRDYETAQQLYNVLKHRGIAKNIHLIDRVCNAWETKAVIGKFDMIVSGRIHGAVAGLSQSVPTVVIDYGHEPKAHKLKGFCIEAGVENFLADPAIQNNLNEKIERAFSNLEEYRKMLDKQIPLVKTKARKNFDILSKVMYKQ